MVRQGISRIGELSSTSSRVINIHLATPATITKCKIATGKVAHIAKEVFLILDTIIKEVNTKKWGQDHYLNDCLHKNQN